ncbi:MAG: hypothetical protein MZV70_74450 [Desulfobacterales bacterium]|nr:hypothetical protein [Desulfobacterales bacterium]
MTRDLPLAVGARRRSLAVAAGAAALQQAPPRAAGDRAAAVGPVSAAAGPAADAARPAGRRTPAAAVHGPRARPRRGRQPRARPARPTTAASRSRGCATRRASPRTNWAAAGSAGAASGAGGGPPWSHDYPRAERNFMKILDEITTIAPYTGPIGGVILDIGSPEIMKFPVVATWPRRATGRRPTRRPRTSAPTC